MSVRALEELRRVLDQGGEPDNVLRLVVAVLADEPTIAWAGIAFVEDEDLALGPEAGERDESRRLRFPIAFHGAPVGELWVDGEVDPGALQEVAQLLSAHVLIGWDTRGQAWEP